MVFTRLTSGTTLLPRRTPTTFLLLASPGPAGTRATSTGSLPTARQLCLENQHCSARGREKSKEVTGRGVRNTPPTRQVLCWPRGAIWERWVRRRTLLLTLPTPLRRYPKDVIFGRITTQWYRDAFFQYSKRSRWFLSLLQNTCRWGVSGKDKEALTSLDEVLGAFLLQCHGCKCSSCLQVKTEGCWDAKKD